MRPAPLLLLLAGLATTVACQGRGPGSGAPGASASGSGSAAPPPAPPLKARTVTVKAEPLDTSVPTVGTLVANEQVRIVSEVSRRLVKIHVQEGALVKKGEVLFTLDSADLQAQLRRVAVRRRLAELEAKRLSGLVAEGLATQAEYDRARSTVEEARAEAGVLAVGLAKARITAPFAGRVGLRRVSEGAWVTPEVLLTTLQDVSRLKVDFTVPERYGANLAAGGKFWFRLASLPERFDGAIVAIEGQVEQGSRSVLVRGTAESAHPALLPGGFVTVELPLGDKATGLLIPSEAVVPTVDGQAVFVARDGKARRVKVELGVRLHDRVEVVRGLAEGDKVIVSNLLRLRDGAPILPEG